MSDKKLKPFDLKAALNGEPVMLRNGAKAYVRHHETELPIAVDEVLFGYVEGVGLRAWCDDGVSCLHECESQYDIIGMHPRNRIINGFKVPAPETEELAIGSRYFIASNIHKNFFNASTWCDYECDNLWLKRGLVFLNKEDAIANTKAILGIDPNSPSMD